MTVFGYSTGRTDVIALTGQTFNAAYAEAQKIADASRANLMFFRGQRRGNKIAWRSAEYGVQPRWTAA